MAATVQFAMAEAITEMLNNQASRELCVSNSYLAASFWFRNQNYEGIAKYMEKDSLSERDHALKIFEYIQKRGGITTAHTIPAVDTSAWKKCSDVVKSLLQQEVQVAETLKDLTSAALQANDHMTVAFLHDFHIIQTNEVDEMTKLYLKTQAYEALPGLMYHLDSELS